MRETIVLIINLFLLFSCTKKIDKVLYKGNYGKDFELRFEENVNILDVHPVTNALIDGEYSNFESFIVPIPKGIVDYKIISLSDFIFYYPKMGVIYINVESGKSQLDPMEFLENEAESITFSKVKTGKSKGFFLKENIRVFLLNFSKKEISEIEKIMLGSIDNSAHSN